MNNASSRCTVQNGNEAAGQDSALQYYTPVEVSDMDIEGRKAEQTVGISFTVPTPDDVLLRSGEDSRKNPGNVRFHEVSSAIRSRFAVATDRQEKNAIARDLSATIQSFGGRFLDFDSTASKWYEIDARRRHRKCLAELSSKNTTDRETRINDVKDEVVEDLTPDDKEKEKEDCPHQPPIPDVVSPSDLLLSQSISLDIIFQSVGSAAQIFSSTESMARLLASQSAISISLPPLPSMDQDNPIRSEDTVRSGGCGPTATTQDQSRAVESTDKQHLSIRELVQSISRASQSSQLGEARASMDFTPMAPAWTASLSSISIGRPTSNLPDAQASVDRVESGGSGPTTIAQDQSVVAESAERQNMLIQGLLQSISRAAQSAALGQARVSSSEDTSASASVGFFASRGWGNDLGPVQDVDFQNVFQSISQGDTLPGNVKPSGRKQKDAVPSDPDSELQASKKNNGKRDWDALVMKGLQASMTSPVVSSISAPTGGTSADGLLAKAIEQASLDKSPDCGGGTEEPVENPSPPKLESRWPKRKSKPEVSSRFVALPITAPTGCTPPGALPVKATEQVSLDRNPDCVSGTDEPIENPAPTRLESRWPKRKSKYDISSRFLEPNDLDVLLGRGGRTNNHPGNKRYLEVKDNMQSKYLAADKNDKTPISQELMDIVHAWGGRFLKLDPSENRWFEIDESTARKKCSQTLREINTPAERATKRAKYAK